MYIVTDVVSSRRIIGAKMLKVDLSHLLLDETGTFLFHPEDF